MVVYYKEIYQSPESSIQITRRGINLESVVIMENLVLNLSHSNHQEIPAHLIDSKKSSIKFLDVSYNALSDCRFLYGFVQLKLVNLDNNEISTLDTLPSLPLLDTLSINNNSITSLDCVIQAINLQLPQLKNLSLMKNPCCPIFNTSSTEEELVNYRLKIISGIQQLKNLDGSVIKPQEKLDALSFARSQNQQEEVKLQEMPVETERLPELAPERTTAYIKPTSKKKNAISEGNRFITNSDL